MPRVEGRPGSSMEPLDFENLKKSLESTYDNITERDVMSAALYPKVTEDYLTFRESFGPVDKLKTRIFLTGPKVGEEFEVSIIFFEYLKLSFKHKTNYLDNQTQNLLLRQPNTKLTT